MLISHVDLHSNPLGTKFEYWFMERKGGKEFLLLKTSVATLSSFVVALSKRTYWQERTSHIVEVAFAKTA